MIPWLVNYPLLTLVFTLVLMWIAMWVGQYLGRRKPPTDEDSKDLDRVTSASLTLLALIIGFSFSMAVGRYDLRKNYEEEEANAIGTEYVRAGLLPGDSPTKVREVLKKVSRPAIAVVRGDRSPASRADRPANGQAPGPDVDAGARRYYSPANAHNDASRLGNERCA